MRIDVWFASVTVGSPAIAPYSYAVPMSMQARDVRRFAGGGQRVQHVRVGAVEQEPDHVPRPAAGEVEHVVADLAVLAGDVRPVVGGSAGRAARATVGRHVDESARPSAPARRRARPCPAITNGARACTTPSDPCSPRWPPWSSQLWAAEWITHRSGAAGWSKSWATCRTRTGRSSRRGWGRDGRARRPARRTGPVDWSARGSAPSPAIFSYPPPSVRRKRTHPSCERASYAASPARAGPCRRWDRGPSRAAPRARARRRRSRSAVISWTRHRGGRPSQIARRLPAPTRLSR